MKQLIDRIHALPDPSFLSENELTELRALWVTAWQQAKGPGKDFEKANLQHVLSVLHSSDFTLQLNQTLAQSASLASKASQIDNYLTALKSLYLHILLFRRDLYQFYKKHFPRDKLQSDALLSLLDELFSPCERSDANFYSEIDVNDFELANKKLLGLFETHTLIDYEVSTLISVFTAGIKERMGARTPRTSEFTPLIHEFREQYEKLQFDKIRDLRYFCDRYLKHLENYIAVNKKSRSNQNKINAITEKYLLIMKLKATLSLKEESPADRLEKFEQVFFSEQWKLLEYADHPCKHLLRKIGRLLGWSSQSENFKKKVNSRTQLLFSPSPIPRVPPTRVPSDYPTQSYRRR